ncbi:MAG TPA: S1 RNA-binding domain-containing protein [Pseudonocardiaceae bacterium]|jgi:small subunit ribosomal protein S1|nr:S1 RNA-binding domain-containing protein [Pseudonocardiaceae bacterium]
MSESIPGVSPEAWREFLAAHAEGDVLTGQVASIVPFGSFVELGSGVVGLLHVSEYVGGEPELGSSIPVRIHAVDRVGQRLSLKPA